MHFCTFPFLAVMADTTRLASPSRICKSAKLQFCIFACLHFSILGCHGWHNSPGWPQLNMQKCKAAVLHFCIFTWESWHSWQCKTAKMLEHARTQTLHFSTLFWYGWHEQGKDVVAGKAAVLHFCIFSWESWHNWQCKIAKMLKHARTQTLHFSTFSGVQLAWARQGCGGWHKQHMQKCICIFALSAGTAGMGMGKERVVWLAQVEYAKMQKCIFPLSAGMLAWVKRMAWLAQTEYAKVQRCSFCIFALSAVMAGTVKLMTCKWYLQTHTFCTWLVRLAWAKDGATSPTGHWILELWPATKKNWAMQASLAQAECEKV